MPHRAHLFSLRIANALRESCFKEAYGFSRFKGDLLAGLTVGIIAIPLAMALAIAVGVAPQQGLYTAIVAGFVIALLGGSRYSVSGPTAAFVVILHPIVTQFGLSGLLVATVMAGMILVALAIARLGRLIEYIPEPVTLGFTSGIAIVIAVLQIKDFFGLQLNDVPDAFSEKITVLVPQLLHLNVANTLVATATLLVLVFWSRLKVALPGHLPALALGMLLAWIFSCCGLELDTIGSRFSYVLPDGSRGQGIPPVLPHIDWPWAHTDAAGLSFHWSLETFRALLPAAFSIAMLGAIESLLCAVILDGMTGKRHNANSELLGQGIGNIVAPFFGGITATAALARSVANVRAGATSPLASMIHALVVLLGLLLLAPVLAYVPMASMAALLLMVAWNMSEAHKVVELIRKAPRTDVLLLLSCLLLTVFVDMVVAIGFGMVLAAILFVRDIADMTKVTDISTQKRWVTAELPAGWVVYRINGPLFFAAADRIFSELLHVSEGKQGLILVWDAVPLLDAGGLSALSKFFDACQKRQICLLITDLQFQPLRTLARAEVQPMAAQRQFFPSLTDALSWLEQSSFSSSDNKTGVSP